VPECQRTSYRTAARPLRIVLRVDAEVAFGRSLRRREANPLRRAHADPGPADAAERARAHRAFDRLSLDAPWIEVDTTDGYAPALEDIVAFAFGRELRPVRRGAHASRAARPRRTRHGLVMVCPGLRV
jgi:hypothetical protein